MSEINIKAETKRVSYWKYAKPFLPAFILGPILMIVEVIGEVFMPQYLADIINYITYTKGGSTVHLALLGLKMVGVALVMMLGGVGGAYFSVVASTGFANGMRKDLFNKVQSFSFSNIDNFTTGSLVTRITNDVTQIQNMIGMLLRMALRAPGMMIGAVIMAFAINKNLALIIVFVMPILLVLLATVIRIAFPRFGIMQKKLDSLNSTIQEGLTNIRVIKSFVREDFEEKRFNIANMDLKDKTLRALRVMIFTMPIMMFAMNATIIAVVWFGGSEVISGGMEVGNLSQMITYVTQILMSLMMLAMIIINSSRALVSSKRIREVLDAKPDLTDDNASMKDAKVTDGAIEFRDVCFKYYKNSEEWVLENINLKIAAGETVGIIGSTGSGKSSLIHLIPRLYDADKGSVLVDGTDVREYSLKNLRKSISCVLQKNVLFSGTIEDNLRWGDDDADIEEIKAAAKAAQAAGFIESSAEGYDREIEQGGVNVSGGQRQRLCIARAILAKPKILILDDSTSAVDTATEARIRESFRTSLKDSTKIIIAQRISSVIDADKIIVIDDGKIVGEGAHDELIRTCEEYKEICASQLDKEVTA